MDIQCDLSNWVYEIATATPTGSTSFEVLNTATLLPDPPEYHTFAMSGSSGSGGEIYGRDLLLVSGYYFKDVATQFDCSEGTTNNELTWKIDLYSDAVQTDSIGCVTLGHDPSFFSADDCLVWSE